MSAVTTTASPLSRSLRPVTAVLSLGAGVWVVWTLAGDGDALGQLLRGRSLAWLGLGALAYAALTVVLTLAWWWLCALYGQRPTLLTAYVVWARSQIAKYLPGNIFHYVGRQVMGRAVGMSHATLAGSAVLETVSLILAAGLLALHRLASGEWGSPLLPVAIAVVFLALLPVADGLIRRRLSGQSDDASPAPAALRLSRLLAPTVLLHAFFLVGTGAILLGIVMMGGGGADVDPRSVLTAYAAAWLAGMLMPGAPAGMGMREMVLMLELEPVLGPAHASAVALGLRLVTTAGDLLTALLGHLLPLAKNPTLPPAAPPTTPR